MKNKIKKPWGHEEVIEINKNYIFKKIIYEKRPQM